MARGTITIRNESTETISLIPFPCHHRENPRAALAFQVRGRLARNIPAGGRIEVQPEDYNQRDGVSEFQIHMLFRRGEFPRNVQPGEEENIFLYTDLAANAEWTLSLEDGKVIGGPGRAADQAALGANAAGPLDALRDEVRRLTVRIETLEKRVEDLAAALARR